MLADLFFKLWVIVSELIIFAANQVCNILSGHHVEMGSCE